MIHCVVDATTVGDSYIILFNFCSSGHPATSFSSIKAYRLAISIYTSCVITAASIEPMFNQLKQAWGMKEAWQQTR
jgi:hypothetical protein